MSRFLDLIDRTGTWMSALAAVALALLTLTALVEVVVRSVFSYSIPVALEYNTYLLAIVMTGGAALAMRQGAHIRVEALISLLPARARHWLDVVATITALAVGIGLTAGVIDMALENYRAAATSYYPSETPLAVPQAIFVLPLALLALATLARLIRLLTGRPAQMARLDGINRDEV